MRMWIRRLYFLPVDLWEGLSGKRAKYEPPKGKTYVGSGDFVKQGQHQLQLLQEHIDLKPNDHVLDIGSGIGRTAAALTDYLSDEGKYEGFDVVEKGVRWCKRKISRDHPNFHFTFVPLHNDLYNREAETADQFRFPYDDNTFDKVFLFSVFTHMMPDEVAHYFKEIKRVLKPGGQCLTTMFIYESTLEPEISECDGFKFKEARDGYRLMDAQVQSANIAFSRTMLDEMLAEAQLTFVKLGPGFWRPDVPKADQDFQDVVVVQA